MRDSFELAPRLVGHGDLGQPAAALELEAPSPPTRAGELPPTGVVARQPGAGDGGLRHAPLAARNPASRSARMSSIGLDADGETDQIGRHAGRRLLRLGELGVRGRGGVNRQAPHVADVGQVAEQFEAFDEPAPGLGAARQCRRR